MTPENLRASFLLAHNFTQKDIENAFQASPLGWDYFWDKLRDFCDDSKNSSEGFTFFVLYLDHNHLTMLRDYVVNYK